MIRHFYESQELLVTSTSYADDQAK